MVLIYCIEDINGLKYVGSTKRNMYIRFREHYSQKKMNTAHCTSKKLDLLNCEIYELEWCEDSNRKERESYWINKLDCVNEIKYNYDEKEYNKQYSKKYQLEHRQEIKEYNINYYKNFSKNIKDNNKNLYHYQKSWGGDKRTNNNLLEIDVKLFEY